MNDWPQIRALCQRLRVSETKALNAMQGESHTVISDYVVTVPEIADADVPAALAFIKARFGPEQPEML